MGILRGALPFGGCLARNQYLDPWGTGSGFLYVCGLGLRTSRRGTTFQCFDKLLAVADALERDARHTQLAALVLGADFAQLRIKEAPVPILEFRILRAAYALVESHRAIPVVAVLELSINTHQLVVLFGELAQHTPRLRTRSTRQLSDLSLGSVRLRIDRNISTRTSRE